MQRGNPEFNFDMKISGRVKSISESSNAASRKYMKEKRKGRIELKKCTESPFNQPIMIHYFRLTEPS